MARDKTYICARCRFGRWVDLGEDGGMLTACCYILKTGERRGCPAGEGCTKYQKRTRRAFTEGWFEGR